MIIDEAGAMVFSPKFYLVCSFCFLSIPRSLEV